MYRIPDYVMRYADSNAEKMKAVESGAASQNVILEIKDVKPYELTDEQKLAELFNPFNYRSIEAQAKNRYFEIINPNHRLFGKGIIVGITNGKTADKCKLFFIDAEDFEKVRRYSISLRPGGYCCFGSKNVSNAMGQQKGTYVVCLHKFLTGFSFVNHVNGNPLDNYKSNLEASNYEHNNQYRKDTKFGVAGIKLSTNIKNTNTRQLWESAVQFMDNGVKKSEPPVRYREYLVAVHNHCIKTVRNIGIEALPKDEQLKQIILTHAKYSTLKGDYKIKMLYDFLRAFEALKNGVDVTPIDEKAFINNARKHCVLKGDDYITMLRNDLRAKYTGKGNTAR